MTDDHGFSGHTPLTLIHTKYPGVGEANDRMNTVVKHDYRGGIFTYHVERVDRNLLAAVPRLIDGKTCVLNHADHPGWNGWHTEVFYTYHKHRISGQIGSLHHQENHRDLRTVQQLITASDRPIDFICRQEITGWDDSTGTLVGLSVRTTVYKAPKRGFAALLATVHTEDAMRVHARLDGLQEVNLSPEIAGVLVRVQERVARFQREVYDAGFRAGFTNEYQARLKLGDIDFWLSVLNKTGARMGLYRGDVHMHLFHDGSCENEPGPIFDIAIKPSRFNSGGRLVVEEVRGSCAELFKLLDDATRNWQTSGVTKP